MGLDKITIHWTAGKYDPNWIEIEAYHFLIDGTGKVHKGKFNPEDNESIRDGNYAAHAGQFNTGNIGIAMCGMFRATESNFGDYPLLPVQYESCIQLAANLCEKYGISPDTTYIHSEIRPRFGVGNAKWDVNVLPNGELVTYKEAGKWFRDRIKEKLGKNDEPGIKDEVEKFVGGWSSDYYKLPEGATELDDVIVAKNMPWHIANIFKACYRYGEKNEPMYEIEKILWFAIRHWELKKKEEESKVYPANITNLLPTEFNWEKKDD